MGNRDRPTLRDVHGITHPPLPPEELKRISALHKSHDAILLLREIERLQVVVQRARQIANAKFQPYKFDKREPRNQ